MTRLEDPSEIESIVGAKRHQTEHIGRAVSAEQQVYIVHSVECVEAITASGSDLRACKYSRALDQGIDMDIWEAVQDETVMLGIGPRYGVLLPFRVVASS